MQFQANSFPESEITALQLHSVFTFEKLQFTKIMITFAISKTLFVNSMDFVNRLKTFMNSQTISSTQFADACRIPRPTLSQILSGRNKKISDEVIGKIHDAYPTLSVLWLLFGEGSMLTGSNTQISEAQNSGQIDFSRAQSIDNNINKSSNPMLNDMDIFATEKSESEAMFDIDKKREENSSHISIEDESDDDSGYEHPMSSPKNVSISADGNKSIVNIVVFYSDNSFQSFVPS